MKVTLVDNDADGVVTFSWDRKHQGVDIILTDIFDNTVCGTFYKKDLLKLISKLQKKLELI